MRATVNARKMARSDIPPEQQVRSSVRPALGARY
jgi:hypothetical protein